MIKKNILILIGLLSLSYILVFLLSEKDITDYTVVDTEYWRQTQNRLLTKTAYEYNNKEELKVFPEILGDYKSYDYKYSEDVYKILNADIVLSRTYVTNKSIMWLDFINSKTGESFHKQRICILGSGWTIDKEDIAEFKIADFPNPFTKLYTNRLDITRKNEKQIVIYWFMFKKFGSKDSVTMIRISSPVPNNETETFGQIKNFVESQLFDAMYKKGEVETITNFEDISKEYGNKGLAALTILILIPIGMVIAGIRKKE